MSFAELLVDCLHQLWKMGRPFLWSLVTGDQSFALFDLVFPDVWFLHRSQSVEDIFSIAGSVPKALRKVVEIPEPTCLGDLEALMMGPALLWNTSSADEPSICNPPDRDLHSITLRNEVFGSFQIRLSHTYRVTVTPTGSISYLTKLLDVLRKMMSHSEPSWTGEVSVEYYLAS